jgi:hypothetical protein
MDVRDVDDPATVAGECCRVSHVHDYMVALRGAIESGRRESQRVL